MEKMTIAEILHDIKEALETIANVQIKTYEKRFDEKID